MGHDPLNHGSHFWSQKFYRVDLDVWELASVINRPGYVYKDSHLDNAMVYIRNNREKHNLPASKKLRKFKLNSEQYSSKQLI